MTSVRQNLVLFLTGFAVVVAMASAQTGSGSRSRTDQALSAPSRIVLEAVPLRDALESISKQTGVRVHMASEHHRFIPGGATTPVTARLEGIPIREALENLFQPIGMQMLVVGDIVEVFPSPAIRKLGRAPTWDELELFQTLLRLEPSRDPEAARFLLATAQFRVRTPNAAELFAEALNAVGAGNAIEAMDVACGQLGWEWSLAGKHVAIMPVEELHRQKLQAPVSLRMNNRRLVDVISAVSRDLDVGVAIMPGALAAVPRTAQENFTLNVREMPGEQVLEMICGQTGLGYHITGAGVEFYSALAPQTASASSVSTGQPQISQLALAESESGAGSRDPYIGQIIVPLSDGTQITWLIRASEAPPELLEARREVLERVFRRAIEELHREGR